MFEAEPVCTENRYRGANSKSVLVHCGSFTMARHGFFSDLISFMVPGLIFGVRGAGFQAFFPENLKQEPIRFLGANEQSFPRFFDHHQTKTRGRSAKTTDPQAACGHGSLGEIAVSWCNPNPGIPKRGNLIVC